MTEPKIRPAMMSAMLHFHSVAGVDVSGPRETYTSVSLTSPAGSGDRYTGVSMFFPDRATARATFEAVLALLQDPPDAAS